MSPRDSDRGDRWGQRSVHHSHHCRKKCRGTAHSLGLACGFSLAVCFMVHCLAKPPHCGATQLGSNSSLTLPCMPSHTEESLCCRALRFPKGALV